MAGMGVSHSVELLEDQDSPTEPGKKSIISASVDDLDPPVSGDQLISEYVAWLKKPIDPMTEAILKSCTVTDDGPDACTVKVVLDGIKLDSYGYGKGDGTDRVRSWKKVVVDKAAGKVVTSDYVSEPALGAWLDEATDKEVLATSTFQVLKDPTRIEFSVVTKDGERLSGAFLRDALYALTDRLIGEIHDQVKAKVKVTCGKAIKTAGEDSVISQPLDEHADYESYFDKMVAVLREKLEKIPNVEMEDISGAEFRAKVPTPPKEGDSEERKNTIIVKHSVESGEMTVTTRADDGQVVSTTFRQVHKTPFVVEAWNIDRGGERSVGDAFAKEVQKQVNEVIERLNSWFG